jgi:hypothetical protein
MNIHPAETFGKTATRQIFVTIFAGKGDSSADSFVVVVCH